MAAMLRAAAVRTTTTTAVAIGGLGRRAVATATTAVPRTPYTGPAAWYGRDLAAAPERWLHTFTPAEVAAIDRTVDALLARGTLFEQTTRADFDFGPALNALLARTLDQVVHGIGFVLFRGLPVERCVVVVLCTRAWSGA
jgi:hypothetical protein